MYSSHVVNNKQGTFPFHFFVIFLKVSCNEWVEQKMFDFSKQTDIMWEMQ